MHPWRFASVHGYKTVRDGVCEIPPFPGCKANRTISLPPLQKFRQRTSLDPFECEIVRTDGILSAWLVVRAEVKQRPHIIVLKGLTSPDLVREAFPTIRLLLSIGLAGYQFQCHALAGRVCGLVDTRSH